MLALHKLGAITIPATNQLVEHDFDYRYKAAKVKAIVCTADGDVSREAEKAKMPFVVTVASSADLLKNGYEYTFRIQPSTEVFSRNFLEYLSFVKTDDMKTVAFIYEDSNYGSGIVNYILEHIDETGLEVVGAVSYSSSTSTLSAEVTRLAALNPDLLVPIGYYSDQAMLVKELLDREITFDTIMGVANGAISDAKLTNIYGNRIDGYLDINYRYNPNTEETSILLEKYLERYGEDMPVAAIYGYESIIVIANALERCERADFSDLRDKIASTNISYHALPQSVIAFDETGEGTESAGVLIQIQNGKQTIVYPLEYAEGEYQRKGNDE
jgi:branched-chain amino acid transport system substrate-binding protein